MITKETTQAPFSLAARPATRAEAETVLRAFVAGSVACADDDDTLFQYGRILSVLLWDDVNQTDFALLVEDAGKLAQITAGVPLDGLVGDVNESERGDWLFYYETQVNWRVNVILDAAGYGR